MNSAGSFKSAYINVTIKKKSYISVGFAKKSLFYLTIVLILWILLIVIKLFELFENGGINIVLFYPEPHNSFSKFQLLGSFRNIPLCQIKRIYEHLLFNIFEDSGEAPVDTRVSRGGTLKCGRQVMGPDNLVDAQDGSPFDAVFKFPDISRPMVG